MMFVMYVLYILLIFVFVLDLYLAFKFFEYLYCTHILKQPPMVASNYLLRQALVDYINTYHKNVKNICDIGSGFGGLVRLLAEKTNANVYGLENMPFSVLISRIYGWFYRTNSKIIWCDAFDWLDKSDIIFDVVVAYLGPDAIQKVLKYKNKMHILISMDFKLKNIKPVHVIKMSGATRYKGNLYPHMLYVYKFQ